MAIFPFDIHASEGKARTGVLKTPRGDIRTPAFMPVGTAGTVKGVYMDQVKETGADIILGNTYHLMLRPGAERVKKLGGLHKFGGWSGPILTDSGGFQVWSLSKLRKMSEEGVEFQSHLDGSRHMLSPERSIEIQADLLGADISMQLDECTDFPSTHEQAKKSMELSLRWGKRSLAAFGDRKDQTLFAIIQGSIYEDLRQRSAEASLSETTSGGYGGFAIGGLAVGEGHEAMCNVLEFTVPHLPESRPRYLMGVGKPIDLVESVARGVDMFDCVIPTRSGRHGQVWTDEGPYNIKRAEFAEDQAPLDGSIKCEASQSYSKAYIHHLIRSKEMLGAMILSWHNIAYFEDLMARIRTAIAEQRFKDFADSFRSNWKG
ncbi:tRNA guanosine(34) transglycosylase Tgt [Litorimonas haliclonae]|uniref:tRNA guanosine(34) transglycosylase Tgt n=1 Tax=Litorimonas haliclonae TaxID=2081977 RepID=UPI0039EFC082